MTIKKPKSPKNPAPKKKGPGRKPFQPTPAQRRHAGCTNNKLCIILTLQTCKEAQCR
jgi:hypothetical protein